MHNTQKRLVRAVTPVLLAILTACTPVGPDYTPPAPVVPESWSLNGETAIAPAQLSRWWHGFDDPLLSSLIERAAETNQDLRIATARIREARAQRTIAAASFSSGTSLAADRVQKSENAGSSGTTHNLFDIGFDADWELDIFGGRRRAVEAADATFSAMQEDLRDTLVTLESEVARSYIELRGNQQRLEVARENIAIQEKTVELIEGRLTMGLGNQLELENARTALALTKAQVPSLNISTRTAMHQLAILLGQPPQTLVGELLAVQPIPSPPAIPQTLPSDLLRQRPDIRGAERRLAAATAEIGVATADLFPRFSLAALLGLQSYELGNLITGGSSYWSFGPTLQLALFDRGKRKAVVTTREAERDMALAQYEKVVLTSLGEVENGLVAYAHEQESLKILREAVTSGEKALAIAQGMYESGLTDFLHVLQSEHAVYQSRDQFVQSSQQLALDVVTVFKTLGGGWSDAVPGSGATERSTQAPLPAGNNQPN